jgi:hypothetical protein
MFHIRKIPGTNRSPDEKGTDGWITMPGPLVRLKPGFCINGSVFNPLVNQSKGYVLSWFSILVAELNIKFDW